MIPGETGSTPGTKATAAATPLARLAEYFDINPKAPDLENQVVAALAKHYGVQIDVPASIDIKTGKKPTSKQQRADQQAAGESGISFEPQSSVESSPGGQEASGAALAAIAQKANPTAALEPNATADELFQQLATSIVGDTPGSPATAPGAVGVTGGEAYTRLVKALDSTAVKSWTKGGPKETYKAYISQYLEQGNFLNASANGGTPDNASIASAYTKLLQTAKDGNQSIDAAYAANNAAANTPGGKAPTQAISETAAAVQGMGERLGIYLSPADVTKISNMYQDDVTTQGVTGIEDELKQTVVQYYKPDDPRNPPGVASDLYQQVLQQANAYGIPVAQADIQKWVTDGIKNSAGDAYSLAQVATNTADAAATHFQQLAAGLSPSLAPQIQSGQSVATLISPYNSITAELTGIPSSTLADPGAAPGGVTGKYATSSSRAPRTPRRAPPP